jgi:hypothetical protein
MQNDNTPDNTTMNNQPTTAKSTTATATLQEQAAQAQPQWARRKTGPVGRWSTLWPVYAELRGRGFTIREAVHWLIQEGAVKQEDRKKAEYGLPMVNSRRRKEGVVAATPKTAGMRKGRNINKGTDGAKSRAGGPGTPLPPPIRRARPTAQAA